MGNQPGPQDDPVDVQSVGNMDSQPSPQDDLVNVQGDGRQFEGFETIAEAEQVFNWGPPLFVFFFMLSFGVAVA